MADLLETSAANSTETARAFWARTTDDVTIRGQFVSPAPGAPIVVVCHGFTGTHQNKAIRGLADGIAHHYGVATFDFRGHGNSTGQCTLGDAEALDIEAVAQTLRRLSPGSPLVGLGFSMGAGALIRAAALHGGFDTIVAVSCPAKWRVPRSGAAILATFLTRTGAGRKLLRRFGVHVYPTWTNPASPVQVADAISPVPVALVYGTEDKYFSYRDGIELYEALRAPKSLLTVDGGGHGEQLADSDHAELWATLIDDLLTTGEASHADQLIQQQTHVLEPEGDFAD